MIADHSLSPETGLSGLNRRLRTLLETVPVIKAEMGKDQHEHALLKAYRSTAITELFHDRYIIAIAGMQGVGKSTLLKQLYDLDDDYIPRNIGRGEKIPVLVTEHAGADVRASVRRAVRSEETGFRLEDQALSPEQFRAVCVQPGEYDLWLELHVPFRHLNTSEQSFALLPGIEVAHNEVHTEWQAFVRYTLTMASTCIMVFDRTKMAQGHNRELLQQLANDFAAAKPIFALSFADQRNAQENEDFRRKVVQTFAVPEHEANRVVLTGTGEYNRTWVAELMAAVAAYSVIPREFRRNQLAHLNKLLSELTTDLGRVQSEVARYDLKSDSDATTTRLLDTFQSERDKLRLKVEKGLRAVLDTHHAEAVRDVQSLIIARVTWSKITQFVLGRSFAEDQEFKRAVEAIWAKPRVLAATSALSTGNEAPSTPLPLPFFCNHQLQALVHTELDRFRNMLPVAEKSEDSSEGTEPSEQTGPIPLPLLNNINHFFAPGSEHQTPVVLQKDAVRIIPVIILQQLASSFVASQVGLKQTDEKAVATEQGGNLEEHLKVVTPPSGAIVNGAALILGLDAVDGQINTVPAVLKALGLGASTAAFSMAVSLCGLVSLGFVAANVSRQFTKQDFRDEDAARNMTALFKDAYLQAALNRYDELMDQAFDRLQRRINERLHKDASFARWERVRYALGDATNHVLDMQEKVSAVRGYLG